MKTQCTKCSKVLTTKQGKATVVCDVCGASIELTSQLPQGIKRANSDLKNMIDTTFKDFL